MLEVVALHLAIAVGQMPISLMNLTGYLEQQTVLGSVLNLMGKAMSQASYSNGSLGGYNPCHNMLGYMLCGDSQSV